MIIFAHIMRYSMESYETNATKTVKQNYKQTI